MSRATRAVRRPAAADGEPLVVLEGGPLGGTRNGRDPTHIKGAAWYTAADWAEQVRLAQWAADTHGHPPDHPSLGALRYEDTGEWVEHPRPEQWPAGGTVWRWQRRPADD